MRDLTSNEQNSVSGGRMVPAPRVPTTLFGVKLSKKDQAALAAVIKLLGSRGSTK